MNVFPLYFTNNLSIFHLVLLHITHILFKKTPLYLYIFILYPAHFFHALLNLYTFATPMQAFNLAYKR